MSIPAWFLEVARGILSAETFDDIYQRAVAKERAAVERREPDPKRPAVSAVMLAKLERALNKDLQGPDAPAIASEPLPKNHAQERLEKRMDLAVTQGDMAELLRFIQAGGPNVEVIRQRMDLTQELVVNWRGKHFNVVWSKSSNKLITVWLKTKKSKQFKVQKGRPKDARMLADLEAEAD